MPDCDKSVNFADQLPVVGAVLPDPRQEEIVKYREMFFDPRYDGFGNELEYVADLPIRSSKQVQSSPLGVGFEVLDHRTAYIFSKAVQIARESGVKWARVQSGWQRAEQTPGVYNFDWLDEIVDGLLEAGIQPWISFSFGNKLYMPGAEALPPHGNYFFSPTRFGSTGIQGWQNYCRAMVKHFGSRVTHWEVWNEPNAGFLRKPNTGKEIKPEPPEVYAELVKYTYEAVKEIQPEAKIIAGSISGCGICNEYIKGLFDNNIAEYMDIFSYHPYNGIPELYYGERLQFIRDLIRKSGRDIPIWQGENGRPSNSALLNRGYKATEGSQARYLTRRYLTDLRLGVEMSSYFLICDIGNGYLPNGNVHSQGVIDATDPENYRPKLAFRAMQSMAWLFDSRTEKINACFELYPMLRWALNTAPVETASGITCAFRKNGVPIFAYYSPTHLDSEWMVKPVRVTTWVDEDLKFEKPILIDPITARVYRIKQMSEFCDGNYGNYLVLPRLPLLDYPLFVTDASLLDDPGWNGIGIS